MCWFGWCKQATKTKTEKIIVRSILQMGLRINGNNMLQRSYCTIWHVVHLYVCLCYVCNSHNVCHNQWLCIIVFYTNVCKIVLRTIVIYTTVYNCTSLRHCTRLCINSKVLTAFAVIRIWYSYTTTVCMCV